MEGVTIKSDPDLVPSTTVITVTVLCHPYLDRAISPLHGRSEEWGWGGMAVGPPESVPGKGNCILRTKTRPGDFGGRVALDEIIEDNSIRLSRQAIIQPAHSGQVNQLTSVQTEVITMPYQL